LSRLLLLGAAAVLVVGGGLPALHLASHRHAICAEHGELVDVTDAHSVDHAGHVAASHVDAEKGSSDEHAHCGVLATLLQSSLRTASAALPATTPAMERIGLAPKRDRALPIAALTRAPKTSPPV